MHIVVGGGEGVVKYENEAGQLFLSCEGLLHVSGKIMLVLY